MQTEPTSEPMSRSTAGSLHIWPIGQSESALHSPHTPSLSRPMTRRLPAKGSIISVMVHELHRQPDVWPDPNRFDPERFAAGAAQGRQKSAYMPFGAGHRICIGIHFALLELVVALAAVARRYSWRLTTPEVPAVGVSTLRPARPVRIALTPRRADAR
jgi:cytochrome P450